MTKKLILSRTNIETGSEENLIEKEFTFSERQEITISLPLSVLDQPDASLGDLHVASVRRAIDLLQGMLDRGE